MARCAECGFLAVRDLQTRELAEVEEGMRMKWELPQILGTSTNRYHEYPLCLVQATNLTRDCGDPYHPDAVRQALWMDRRCDQYLQWRQGFTPKEHVEMRHAERMEQIAEARKRGDEERAEERRRADQSRQDELLARQREREDERDDKQKVWQEQQARKQVVSARVTALLAAALGVILTGLVGDHY